MINYIPKKFVNQCKEYFGFAAKEFCEEHWTSCDRLLGFYEELFKKAKKYGIGRLIPLINPVPKSKKGSIDSPSLAEKKKLLEVVQGSIVLYDSILDAYNRSVKIEPTKNVGWALSRLEHIFNKFHKLIKILEITYHNRNIKPIKNEYDIQWLLRGILSLDFDDIRNEEWTPSYAGSASRMDFLIMPYSIVIEMKMTRDGLDEKKIGEQLIIDIARYQSHPNCKILICFIYDPKNILNNAQGLVNDIGNQSNRNFIAKVIVCP